MRMLDAVARAYGADRLIPAASAHIGLSLSSLGEAGVAMLEAFADEGVRFAIPTTTNVLSSGREDADAAGLQMRALDAVTRMGAIDNCSCNPFSQGHVPRFGQSVAWSESATAPYLNSVLGARTNREGATALATALTGLTPNYGMHLDAERRAGALFRVTASLHDLHRHHLLAAAVCRRDPVGIPAMIGFAVVPGQDALLGFSAALATYSNLAMFHMVGITPEAATLEAIYPDGTPDEVVIGDAELEAELVRMRMCETAEAKVVVIGCPHASLGQLREISMLMAGERVRPDCSLIVHTNRDVMQAAAVGGLLAALRSGGVQLSADTCIYVGLDSYPAGTALVTDSAKMAFLMATRGLRTAVASTRECVRSALGQPIRA